MGGRVKRTGGRAQSQQEVETPPNPVREASKLVPNACFVGQINVCKETTVMYNVVCVKEVVCAKTDYWNSMTTSSSVSSSAKAAP